MKFYIGIVPDFEYSEKVKQVQGKWNDHFKKEPLEPHITVKSPVGLSNGTEWIEEVRSVCNSFQSFEIKLTGIDSFGENVLFVSVESDALKELHQKVVEAVKRTNPYENEAFENQGYHPHVTLGLSENGMTNQIFLEMKTEAERTLLPATSFRAGFLRIYSKENGEESYQKYLDIPFKKENL